MRPLQSRPRKGPDWLHYVRAALLECTWVVGLLSMHSSAVLLLNKPDSSVRVLSPCLRNCSPAFFQLGASRCYPRFVVKPTFQALQTFIDDTVTSPQSDTKQPTLHPMEDMVEALNRKVQFWGAFKEQVPAKERALINTPQVSPALLVTLTASRSHFLKSGIIY